MREELALTPFEKAALDALLLGDDPVLAALRAQAALAGVESRERTGVGLFAALVAPEGAARPNGKLSFKLGDVFGTADGLDAGFGLLLHVCDGLIQTLEAYAFDDHWPDELRNVTFRYTNPAGRDFEAVKKLIHRLG